MPVDGTFPSGTTRLREAQYRRRGAGLGARPLHPVRPVRDRLPAQRDPRQVLRRGRARRRAGGASSRRRSTRAAIPAVALHAAGLRRGLHRLRRLRRELPGASARPSPASRPSTWPTRLPLLEAERDEHRLLRDAAGADRARVNFANVRGVQFLEPLFEFSGACAGCGETPYLKLLSQLFGDRLQIANATGCSSIYGGNLPSTPWTKDRDGRGPAWSNSLFEDNAEFGLGYRLAVDKQPEHGADAARASSRRRSARIWRRRSSQAPQVTGVRIPRAARARGAH